MSEEVALLFKHVPYEVMFGVLVVVRESGLADDLLAEVDGHVASIV